MSSGQISFETLLVGVFAMLLLFFGRKLFVVFLGGLGFLFGYTVARDLFTGMDHNTQLIISLLIGLFGVVLAIQVQKIAIAICGFLAGGMLAYYACEPFLTSPVIWVVVVVTGLAGTMAMALVFQSALVVATAAAGGMLIAFRVPLPALGQIAVAVALTILGMTIQFKMLKPRSKS